jgi:hypothetical protein
MSANDPRPGGLAAALARVHAQLERHARRVEAGADAGEPLAGGGGAGPAEDDEVEVPGLDGVCAALGLSPFERAVLLLCAGAELVAGWDALCARAQGDPQRASPTFALALAALPGAAWGALSPGAPLRRWRLVEVGPAQTLAHAPLRLDERVLHHLVGVEGPDERLAGIVEPAPRPRELSPRQQGAARAVAALWARAAAEGADLPPVQLVGPDAAARLDVAGAACALLADALGVAPLPGVIRAAALPAGAAELETVVRACEREWVLGARPLVAECDDVEGEPAREAALLHLAERFAGPLLLSTRAPLRIPRRPALAVEVPRPSPAEQRAAWRDALGAASGAAEPVIEALAASFDLSPTAIRAACAGALGRADAGVPLADALWDTCRVQARGGLDALAQRIESAAGWDDLVLPPAQAATLRELADQVRHRPTVYERWGFAARGARGLGTTALFAGESGTGKTLAAEVVARELGLDLYRVDLSSLISKYIGETEKNLRRVFDAAEEGGAILLFDEADAVFGKRSEVKDSHDRHANVEVSYLLQRMEAFPGLAVLTTNLPDALDSAFMRRLRFIVHFTFPDAERRERIWRRVFPGDTPTDGLRWDDLARLNVAGGSIRNIALNAAFHAAAGGTPVRMEHVLRAARAEYDKLQRPLPAAEVGGWV